MSNPEIPSPDLRDITGLVSKLDINYAIVNQGNTATPYTVDYAVADQQILQMLKNGEIVSQLIAWRDDHVTDVQFCEPRLISENHVVAAINNPDLANLVIPDIQNNRLGLLTFIISPFDMMQNTLRLIGPPAKIQAVADILKDKLPDDVISYVVASQVANTGNTELGVAESEINDRRPPQFECMLCAGTNTIGFEADGPGGATIPTNLVTATDLDGAPLAVSCSPALGSSIDLDIFNGGPTPMSCSATNLTNGITGTFALDISVVDSMAPIFDPGTGPEDLTVEASASSFGIVSYSLPTASDVGGVDPTIFVECVPASGIEVPFAAPGPTTTAGECVALDDSGNTTIAPFDITVQDTTAPTFDADPLPDVTAEATGPGGANVTFSTPTATDLPPVDLNVNVSCDASSGDLFPIGSTTVTCTARDASGNYEPPSTFEVIVSDTTTPQFDDDPLPNVTAEATSPSGATVNYALPTATDVGDASPVVTCAPPPGSLFPIGDTGVTCTAADTSGNSVTSPFVVTVQDSSAPVITLLGANPQTIEAGTGYIELGATVTDDVDPSPVLMINTALVNTAVVGNYNVFYDAVDASGNPALQIVRTVNVVDTSGPNLDDFDPPEFDQAEPYVLDANSSTFLLSWTGGVDDADPGVTVSCDPGGDPISSDPPLYTFSHEFLPGNTVVTCTALDTFGNSNTVSFTVTVIDDTKPVITLLGDPEITLAQWSGPYTDAGATAVDNADGDLTSSIAIDTSEVDTTVVGNYTVYFSVTDAAGNTGTATRTVNVEFAYAGWTDIDPTKTRLKLLSSNPLYWAWLDFADNPVDSSGDMQHLTVEICATNEIVLDVWGDPGSSGFQFDSLYIWQFNLQYAGDAGDTICVFVESGLTGQIQAAPPITYR